MNPLEQANTEKEVGKKILVIEDDPFLESVMVKKLEKNGYELFAASNAEKARNLLANNGPMNLILLDLVLPGMAGFTFLEELKKEDSQYRDIPVIILSNLCQDEEIERARELGATDFMVKSNHSPKEIIERITNFFEQEA